MVGVLILVLGVDHHHQVRQPHLLLEGHVGRAEYLRLPVPGVAELPTLDGGSVGHMDQAGTYNIVQSVQVYRTGYHGATPAAPAILAWNSWSCIEISVNFLPEDDFIYNRSCRQIAKCNAAIL